MNNNTVRMDVNSGAIIPLNVSTVKTVSMDVTTGGGGGSSKDCLKYQRVPNKYELPNIGKKNYVYVAEDTYNSYMWDPTKCTYFPVGLTTDNLGMILCGDAYYEFELEE